MLTDAQMTDVRRFMGYQVAGTTMPITDDQDVVYLRFGMTIMSLHRRLTSLSTSEEAIVSTYLTTLNQLESDIPATRTNLDTASAAVWVHNQREQDDRARLFDSWRLRLCDFIGARPGPSLLRLSRVVRC